MAEYKVQLKNRVQVAEGTLAFHFEKPADFRFKPGQFCSFTLVDPPETDEEGNKRTFSIASAPHEEDLIVATRMRDTAFKRSLKKAALGTEIKVKGPSGNFVLQTNAARAAVFLTGGIGITPFRSMVLDAARNKLPHRLFLFYSNRRPEDAAFLDELRQLEEKNPNYKLIPTMTEPEKSRQPWKGKTGYIDKQMLQQSIGELTGPVYYIAGPPEMVAGMRKILKDAGVGEDDVRAEDFEGY
ncbi:MAG TPA: FAD-dependent oxidoreductase [Acidobacteriota bacterium]|jgi:ferredoxin-NADP reductase